MNKIRIRLNKLEIIALVAGFVLMVFELAGARILAPGIGSSTYVWTSVIGIIIAALSLGYFTGGKVADSRGYMIDIARLALVAGLAIALTILQYGGIIAWVAETFRDPRWQGVVASLVLFAPTSFVLGMISPYLAKLNVKSLHTTGRSIASLSALNSIGGIIGTFVAGFVLFGAIGSHETLSLTAVSMVAVSWLVVPKSDWQIRAFISLGIAIIALVPVSTATAVSIDTPSARYMISDVHDMRLLTTGPYAAQSGILRSQPDELVFWYTQQLADVVAAAPKKSNILILGGGAFTLPQYLAHTYPATNIDVVEIDPELARIARQYFEYKDPSNVNLIFADARAYVNQTDKRYDIVVVDVYGDAHVPFTLLTKEFGRAVERIVTPDGIVATNLIAGFRDECKALLRALDAPYRMYLRNAAYVIEKPQEKRSNIVAAYSHQAITWRGSQQFKLTENAPYTDNFAPAEHLQHECRRERK